mgnify:CR=1 FL=1
MSLDVTDFVGVCVFRLLQCRKGAPAVFRPSHITRLAHLPACDYQGFMSDKPERLGHPEADALRDEIEKISQNLVELLEQRFCLLRELDQIKRRQGLAVRDPKRERWLTARLVETVGPGIPKDGLLRILNGIFDESVRAMEAERADTE